MDNKNSIKIKPSNIVGGDQGRVRFDEKEGKLVAVPVTISNFSGSESMNVFYYYGENFFNSANLLADSAIDKNQLISVKNVPTYLYLHAVELFLKSKLNSIDSIQYSPSKLKDNFGHNITKICTELKSNNFDWDKTLTTPEKDLFDKICKDYKGKLYNYLDQLDINEEIVIDLLETQKICTKIINPILTD